jgi:hypothetical protein
LELHQYSLKELQHDEAFNHPNRFYRLAFRHLASRNLIYVDFFGLLSQQRNLLVDPISIVEHQQYVGF